MPFLWSASSVVRVSEKSVRSASLGGTFGIAVPAGGVLSCCCCCAAGSRLAGSKRATARASINATTTGRARPVTSASLEDAEVRAGRCQLAIPRVVSLPSCERLHESTQEFQGRGPGKQQRICRAASGRAVAGAVPAQMAPGEPTDQSVHPDGEPGQEQHRDEGRDVMEGARLGEDEIAERIDGDE